MSIPASQPPPESHSPGRYLVFSAIAGAVAGVVTVQAELPFPAVAFVASVVAGWTAGSRGKPGQTVRVEETPFELGG